MKKSGVQAVAALSERRNSSRIQHRLSRTAATKIELTHYPATRLTQAFTEAEESAQIRV